MSFVSCNGKKAENDTKTTSESKESKGKSDSSKLKANPESDFKYTLTDDGAGVKITEYIGKGSKIIIPDTIENLPVLEVTDLAKKDHEYGELYWDYVWDEYRYPTNNITITHISFPDSVRSAEVDLTHYDALEYLKLSAGTLETPDKDDRKNPVTGKALMNAAFPRIGNCAKLKTVIIPEGPTSMPSFIECPSIESIKLPSTVLYVPGDAFSNCGGLKEVIIPDSVTKIAFNYTQINYWGENRDEICLSFDGTNLNLATQAKLKQLGYTGSF